MPKKPEPAKAPTAYHIDLPGRRIGILREDPDTFSLQFAKGMGEGQLCTGFSMTRAAAQAVFQILAMHGFSLQPIAVTMDMPTITWKPKYGVRKVSKKKRK